MIFLTPSWLWLALLPPATLLLALLWQRNRNPRRLVLLHTISPVLRRSSARAKWHYRLLALTGVVAAIMIVIAVARPVQERTEVKKEGDGIDIVLVFDVSESMDATDFEPTRLVVAKEVIANFIRRRANDRIGMITFGGEAITKSPVTRDHDFLLDQVAGIQLRELKQGTAIGMGLANGIARLRSSEAKTKIMVLITDGDSNVGSINPITAAHLAKQSGIRIYTVGIGREDRVVVPIYAYDAFGKRSQLIAQIPSYLNPALLKEVATLTGGKAYMARDPGALSQILSEVDKLEKSNLRLKPVHHIDDIFFPYAFGGLCLLFLYYLLQETRLRRSQLGSAV